METFIIKEINTFLTTNVNYLNPFFTYFSEGQIKEEETLNRDMADENTSGKSQSNY